MLEQLPSWVWVIFWVAVGFVALLLLGTAAWFTFIARHISRVHREFEKEWNR